MEHTTIVSAAELEDYANTKASESVIPELICTLVKETVPDLTVCRIPYGDAVNQPGWDGLVETEAGGRQYVPKTKSYWEIGTGGKPQVKATNEFTKRKKQILAADRSGATFVFATPHSSWTEPAQRKWKKRREDSGWQGIKILDGVQLTDWLREYPAIGLWLLNAMRVTKNIAGLATPAQHWDNLQRLKRGTDPSLPTKTFLAGRDQACTELHRLFRGEVKQLAFLVESEHDAEDFVAAFLASLDADTRRTYCNRCLLVKDADAWLAMANLKSAHVLVAHPSLDLESSGEQLLMAASKHSHAVIIPISGGWASGSDKLIPLRSPSAAVLQTVLTEGGFTHERAQELAAVGASTLAALKRHLLGFGDLPPYATWENARLLAQAGMIGRWSGESLADKTSMEIVLGKTYGEWIEIVRPESLRSDTPLTQRNENWKVISRGEAWSALGPRLSNDDLDRFQKAAVAVLGERDPRFELPKEERFAASVKGKVLKHSQAIREGIAETLALLGSRPGALATCSQGKAELSALLTVRALLANADWIAWASIDSHLPMLAEAAPAEFLTCVEAALLEPATSPFNAIFAQEGSGITGSNHMTGLLWALETLAWHPDHLVRVTMILGELAAIDPGGNWSNRPQNSLGDIFLPWHFQTCAPLAKRKSAVETLLREQPAVGWKLLLDLLPQMHSATSGNRKPAWRDFIRPDWPSAVTNREYAEQVAVYAALAVEAAATDMSRLAELIDRLPDLPGPAHTRVLEHLVSPSVLGLTETSRVILWEALADLAAKHRKFSDAQWALPPEAVTKIEEVAAKIAPQSSTFLHRRLFSERDFDLLEEKGDYTEQQRKLAVRRQAAVSDILKDHKTAGLLEFARNVPSPEKVGEALGRSDQDTPDSELLPALLDSADNAITAFIRGFIWGRYWSKGMTWIDAVGTDAWSLHHKTILFSSLPFAPDVWRRAQAVLGDGAPAYWKSARVNPWGLQDGLVEAAEKLLQYGRPRSALACVYNLIQDKKPLEPALAVRALMESIAGEETANALDQHRTLEVIKFLQDSQAVDPKTMFQIEWSYLPMLDHEFGGTPKTLEGKLASDPDFFCEIIGLIFRSKNDKETVRQPTEKEKSIAQNAYRLLKAWKTVPGSKSDHSVDAVAFSKWLLEVKQKTTESGHFDIAMSQIGQVLPYSPSDQGLWINRTIAEALNAKDAGKMRSGFTVELFNMRGTFTYTGGAAERKLAEENRAKAEALEQNGYHRFATAMRDFAKSYERDADREAQSTPFDD